MRYKRNVVIIICLILSSFILSPHPTRADSIPSESHSSLSVNSTVPADGQTTAIVTVTLRDSSGNPINGHSIVLSDSSNSGVTINTISGTTDVSGHALFSIRSTKAQTDNLDVTDTTANIKFYTLGKITFTIAGCYDSPPGSTPQLVSAVAIGSNKIALTWTSAANPVNHYLVSYGLTSGQYIYGNPNVGGQGTTSYTIGSLSPGKKYYFIVQAVNGCTPGNFSNEISTTAGVAAIEQIPTIDTPTKTNSDSDIAPTDTDIPTLSPTIQPTTAILPTQTPVSDDTKSTMLLIISISIVVIGSIGNVLYWKHEKNMQESINPFEENQ